MKKAISFITLFALFLSLVCTVCSCSDGNVSVTTAGASSTQAPTSSSPVSEPAQSAVTTSQPVTTADPMSADVLFKDYNYNGDIFSIMCITSSDTKMKVASYCDLKPDAELSDPIDVAIFNRNEKVEEVLGITLNVIDMGEYSLSGTVEIGSILRDTILTGNPDEIDAAYVNGYSLISLLSGNVLCDLNTINTLNLDKSWWDADSNRELTINDKLYCASGYFSVRGMLSYPGVFFNKNIVMDRYGVKDIYDTVRKGDWTIDKLTEYSTLMTEASSDTLSIEDRVGFVTEYGNGAYMLAGANEYAYKYTDGKIVFTVNTPTASTSLTKIATLINDKSVSKTVVDAYGDDYSMNGVLKYFSNNNIVFYAHTIYDVLELRSMDSNFGLLPLPKASSKQLNYTCIGNRWFTMYSVVPVNCSDFERAGVVLDALSYYGNTYLRDAIYTQAFTNMKLLRDEDSAEMFGLILDGVHQDFGFTYTTTIYNILSDIAKNPSLSLSSSLKKKTGMINKEIAELSKVFGIAAE